MLILLSLVLLLILLAATARLQLNFNYHYYLYYYLLPLVFYLFVTLTIIYTTTYYRSSSTPKTDPQNAPKTWTIGTDPQNPRFLFYNCCRSRVLETRPLLRQRPRRWTRRPCSPLRGRRRRRSHVSAGNPTAVPALSSNWRKGWRS